eukprot:468807-Amphidinium_carterae.1
MALFARASDLVETKLEVARSCPKAHSAECEKLAKGSKKIWWAMSASQGKQKATKKDRVIGIGQIDPQD